MMEKMHLFSIFFNILRLDNKNSQIQLSNKFITFLICYLSIRVCLNKYLRPWRGVSLITPSSACSPCPIIFSNTALNHYFPKQFQEVLAVENFVITSLYVKHIAFFFISWKKHSLVAIKIFLQLTKKQQMVMNFRISKCFTFYCCYFIYDRNLQILIFGSQGLKKLILVSYTQKTWIQSKQVGDM